MVVQFDEAFLKSLKKLRDKKVKEKLLELINNFEDSENLTDIPNIKKMQGYETYYRVWLGDYRVGFELQIDKSVLFILVAHRKEIYRFFP
ncbi:plasmid stabilization system [Emticicia oligotrophica DSM 17448]|uniref:Plasmid stabilization system n=1 Tax=Emticicia oligotrophica (strain DSM 17448 / CIP 109782 / MTCC 6937 / GPTSA100-15) TaxID=929562 RepID=A0ABM5MZM7_EMTOG|nr:type II toxin-antitoxin system RelE/ParE family toxin [Emticicia oligotrophica]AFK02635.1 plasmid stabilization system [Emticicia oligotrophica DSM 17448]